LDVNQQDIRELRVGDIMQENWPTLSPEQTVEDAIKLFAESGISGAPVVEDGGLAGIVTEGDLIFRDAEIKAPGFLDILGGIIPLGDWDEYRQEAIKSAGVTVGEHGRGEDKGPARRRGGEAPRGRNAHGHPDPPRPEPPPVVTRG
jgi:hypothetical protein